MFLEEVMLCNSLSITLPSCKTVMQSALVALNSKFRAGDFLPKIQREIINGKK